jgi:hypothetical protein
MSVLHLVLIFAGLAQSIITMLVGIEIVGHWERRTRARMEARIASLPQDIQAAWGKQWRSELDDLEAMPVTAARWAQGLRGKVSELIADPVAPPALAESRPTQRPAKEKPRRLPPTLRQAAPTRKAARFLVIAGKIASNDLFIILTMGVVLICADAAVVAAAVNVVGVDTVVGAGNSLSSTVGGAVESLASAAFGNATADGVAGSVASDAVVLNAVVMVVCLANLLIIGVVLLLALTVGQYVIAPLLARSTRRRPLNGVSESRPRSRRSSHSADCPRDETQAPVSPFG